MGGVLFFFVVMFLLFGGFGVVGQIFGLFFGLFGGMLGLVGVLIGLFFTFMFTILPIVVLIKLLSAIFGGSHHKRAWVCTDGQSDHHLEDDFYSDKRKNEDKRKRDLYYRDSQDPYQQDIRIV